MRSLALRFAVFALSLPRFALGTTTDECVDAHVAAQRERAAGALLEATADLVRCGAPACPGVLRAECGSWMAEIENEIPSTVFVVTTSEGVDLTDARLVLDATASEIRPGVAVEMNPGKHTIEVTRAGYEPRRVDFTARAGERQRRLEIALTPISRPPPLWPYFALGGGVVLGAGLFAGFGTAARNGEEALVDCQPNCTDSEISTVRAEYVVANVGLAIAAASLVGVGAYFYFTNTSVSVKPTSSGAGIDFTHRF